MITIIATVCVKNGNMEKAIKFLKEIVPQVRENEPGCFEFVPHTVKGKKFENKIIIYEKYANEEAYMTHLGNLGRIMEDFILLLEEDMDLLRLQSCI